VMSNPSRTLRHRYSYQGVEWHAAAPHHLPQAAWQVVWLLTLLFRPGRQSGGDGLVTTSVTHLLLMVPPSVWQRESTALLLLWLLLKLLLFGAATAV
jgi:hypothetical protein